MLAGQAYRQVEVGVVRDRRAVGQALPLARLRLAHAGPYEAGGSLAPLAARLQQKACQSQHEGGKALVGVRLGSKTGFSPRRRVYHCDMQRPPAVLVANAPLQWTPRMAALAAAADPLLAADGGADHLARIGLVPAAVVGDLDSVRPETLRWLGPERVLERPDQDHTDLEKALHHAFDVLEVAELTVLAALGGRIDHDAGNLGLLARLALGERVVLEDETWRVLALTGRLELDAVPGETWSFWTYDPAVRVTLEGVHWPVVERALDAGGRPSISNRAAAERVTVTAEGGAVVVMRHLAAVVRGVAP